MNTYVTIGVAIAAVLCLPLATQTAAAGYSPDTDSNVFQWLKTDALNQANNSPISSWPASKGQNLANPVTGTQPLFVANQQNGLPGVFFNGTSFLSGNTTFLPVPQPFTAFIVFQYLDSSFATEAMISGISTGNDVRIANLNNNTFTTYAGAGAYSTGGPSSDNFWHVGMFVFNGANSQYKFDNGANIPFASSPGKNAINSILLGQNATLGPTSKFKLGEVVFYSGDQTPNETAIFGYMTNRWNIIPVVLSPGNLASTNIMLGSVGVVWNPVSNAVGYTLYWGPSSGNYTQSTSCPSAQTNLTATELTPNGVYYLAVTASAADGTESPYSNEYIYTNIVNGSGLQPPSDLHLVNP